MLQLRFGRVLHFACMMKDANTYDQLINELELLVSCLNNQQYEKSALVNVFFELSETFKELGEKFKKEFSVPPKENSDKVLNVLESVFPHCGNVFAEYHSTHPKLKTLDLNKPTERKNRKAEESFVFFQSLKDRSSFYEVDFEEPGLSSSVCSPSYSCNSSWDDQNEDCSVGKELEMPNIPYFSKPDNCTYSLFEALNDLARIVSSNSSFSAFSRELIAACYLEECGWAASFHMLNFNKGISNMSNGSHAFLLVSAPKHTERLVIDWCFKDLFEVVRPTPDYLYLKDSLRPVFVGTKSDMKKAIDAIGQYAIKSLKEQNINIPPWRCPTYLNEAYSRAFLYPILPSPIDSRQVEILNTLHRHPLLSRFFPKTKYNHPLSASREKDTANDSSMFAKEETKASVSLHSNLTYLLKLGS